VIKIALADLPARESYYHAVFPNLGLLYLAAALRRQYGSECRILLLEPRLNLRDHLEAVADFGPDLYGVSFAYFTRIPAFRVIDRIKAEWPGLPIVCGGPHPSAAPANVLRGCAADICVRGEGEDAICELAEWRRTGAPGLEEIRGIVYRDAGDSVRETSPRPSIRDLDAIPFPAWDLIDLRRYAGWHIRRASPQCHVFVNRGCPFDCNYCSNPVWKYAKPWLRLRGPESIAEEIRLLAARGVREIYLSADEFNVRPDWTLEVCRAIERLRLAGVYFNCNLRPGPMTAELARAFRRINLWVGHLGIESSNQRTLDGVGKKVRIEEIEETCRILKYEGVRVFGFVMLFHAWEEDDRLFFEDPGDVERTLEFCRRLLQRKLLDYISWQVAAPMPGSRLWETAVRHDLLPKRAIRGVFEPALVLPGVAESDVRKAVRRGLRLKNYYLVRNGHLSLRHPKAVWANLKLMLGFGPPRGAY
jgi:anaerobic magnesium-protoporphyrin IX monomethyl ester cyclase